AVRHLLEIIKIAPEDARAHTQLATIYRICGKPHEALRHFERALRLEGPTPQNLMNVITLAQRVGDRSKASGALATAREFYPTDGKFLRLQAQALFDQGDHENALRIVNERLSENPRDSETVRAKVLFLLELDRGLEARESAQELTEMDPASGHGFSLLAQALLKLGEPHAARAQIDEALRRDPENVGFLRARITIELALDETQAALDSADQLILLNPAQEMSYVIKCKVLIRREQLQEALALIEHRLRINPRHGYSYGVKAKILLAFANYRSALDTLEKGLSFLPDDPAMRGMQVNALIGLGQTDEALHLAAKLKDPFFRQLYSAKARIQKQEWSTADMHLQAIRQDRAVLWMRAHIAFAQGNFRSASAFLVQLLEKPSLKRDLWAIVAYIKIQNQGDSAHSDFLTVLANVVGADEVRRLASLAEALDWTFVMSQFENEMELNVSLINPFWSGLYDRPVDGFTARTLWGRQ
ncbi:MAG: tetratricopeptide repeat protein, partial [Bdellovibrionales bacterium]